MGWVYSYKAPGLALQHKVSKCLKTSATGVRTVTTADTDELDDVVVTDVFE